MLLEKIIKKTFIIVHIINWVYFWADENDPLEPIQVHVSKGKPNKEGKLIKEQLKKKTILIIIFHNYCHDVCLLQLVFHILEVKYYRVLHLFLFYKLLFVQEK